MPLPKTRFTIRSAMIAVGIAAVLLAVEPVLFHYAAEVVQSGDPEYIWDEAANRMGYLKHRHGIYPSD